MPPLGTILHPGDAMHFVLSSDKGKLTPVFKVVGNPFSQKWWVDLYGLSRVVPEGGINTQIHTATCDSGTDSRCYQIRDQAVGLRSWTPVAPPATLPNLAT